jgi:hypothetical protein
MEELTRFLPLNSQFATAATYVYDCTITAWCLHELMYFEYASCPTLGEDTAAKIQVPDTRRNRPLIIPLSLFGAIPSTVTPHKMNICISNILSGETSRCQ